MSDRWQGREAPIREEVLAEIARELAKRRQVFPKWIKDGKLTQKLADERIDRMQAGYDYIMDHWPASQQNLPLT